MQSCYTLSAVNFVVATFARAGSSAYQNIIHWCLPASTRRLQQANNKDNKDNKCFTTWQPFYSDDKFPQELPDGCDNHLVLSPDYIPALLLTKELFDEIVLFAEDFRQMQKLEAFAVKRLEVFNAEADRWHKTISSLQAERDHMIEMREHQYTLDISQIDALQRKIDHLVGLREEYYTQGEHMQAELRWRRKVTISGQFRLSELLCNIFQQAGVMGDAHEQWVGDRRAFRNKVVRLMHAGANEMRKFPFALSHIWNDWRIEDGEFSDDEERSPELTAAIDNFEMCHWNRRVARHEFARRRQIVKEIQKTRPKGYFLDHDAWANAELIGVKHGMQLTANLIDADANYRDAVRELRQNGQSVDTLDSSYIPFVASDAPRMNYSWDRMEDATRKPFIMDWNAAVRDNSDSDSSSHPRPSTAEEQISLSTVEMADCLSGDFNEIWGTEYSAMRQRAWKKLRARRDRKVLSGRKRWQMGSNSDRSSSSNKQKGARARRTRNGLPTMRHLPTDFGMSKFPDGPPPKYRRDDAQKSFPSDQGTQPE